MKKLINNFGVLLTMEAWFRRDQSYVIKECLKDKDEPEKAAGFQLLMQPKHRALFIKHWNTCSLAALPMPLFNLAISHVNKWRKIRNIAPDAFDVVMNVWTRIDNIFSQGT